MKKLLNFIGGKFQEPTSGKFFESFDPSTGKAHLLVSDSERADVDLAVAAAKKAFPEWAAKTPAERAQVLFRISDGIHARLKELALAESFDQGKPAALAERMDIPRAALNFRFFAGSILHESDQITHPDRGSINYVIRKPVGVAGLISPWNLPLYLLTWKIAPALAYGNTAVCKPSEITSSTAHILCEIMGEAGVPPGVINMVFGSGAKAGSALVEHPDVGLISFTGGTATGKTIAQAAAPHFKKLSLELGGKNPNIIFDDANFDQAVETTLRSSFLNQGEICLCGSRIYVQRSIFDRFLESFVDKAERLKVGDPRCEGSFMGPLVSKEHLAKVESFLELAKKENARILCGGGRPEGLAPEFKDGYFLAPTIITDVKEASRLVQEEIFGPVVTVSAFDTEEEVIEKANGTKYGLSASVWTESLTRAMRVAERLDAGTVWVNSWMVRDLRSPFGGVKASGLGREGKEHSRDFFTEAKTISIRHSDGGLK